MEWVGGGSLRADLDRRRTIRGERVRLPWREALTLVQPMVKALIHAHGKGIVHLDLKPANVLLEPDANGSGDLQRPRLADFGLSRLLGKETLQRSAAAAGTAGYMSPERAEGAVPDPRMDVFSMGVILYELLCGRMPGGVFKLPHAVDATIPAGLDAVVARSLAQDPDERYAAATELLAALQSVGSLDIRPARPDTATAPGAPAIITPVTTHAHATPETPDVSEMIPIPAGEFWMGSAEDDAEAPRYEKPRHLVFVDKFEIDRDPVTNARWKRFMDAGGYHEPRWWSEDGWAWREQSDVSQPDYWEHDDVNGPDQPVVGVSWSEAAAFCKWAGKRLPTEAEWEKAARGTDGRKYPWGNEWDAERANSAESRVEKTTPIGRYPQGASPYGVRDLSGNVFEWVGDWGDDTYYKWSPKRNPAGPDSGKLFKVLRGGSWICDSPTIDLRAAQRYFMTRDYRDALIGFRSARGLLAGEP
jgi:serine/threonine-protein kinase